MTAKRNMPPLINIPLNKIFTPLLDEGPNELPVENNTCEACESCICKECGPCECESCDECGMLMCECDEFLVQKLPPWEERGIIIGTSSHKGTWRLIWPEINTAVDPIQYAADFYILEAICGGVLAPISGVNQTAIPYNTEKNDQHFFEVFGIEETDRAELISARDNITNKNNDIKNLQEFIVDSRLYLNQLVNWLDPTFIAYMQMAIGGELRHHKLIGGNGKILSEARPEAWCGWRQIHNTVGDQALLDAAILFREMKSNTSIGGDRWACACEILFSRLKNNLGPNEQMNKQIFIDRVWALEHNGGAFLNKIKWSILNPMGWDISHMKKILDHHGSDTMDVQYLLKICSQEVQTLYSKYMFLVNKVELSRNLHLTLDVIKHAPDPIKVCNYCGGNIMIGHLATCHIATTCKVRYKKKVSKNTVWYTSKQLSVKNKKEMNNFIYTFDAKGDLIIDSTAKYNIQLQMHFPDSKNTFSDSSDVYSIEATGHDILNDYIAFACKWPINIVVDPILTFIREGTQDIKIKVPDFVLSSNKLKISDLIKTTKMKTKSN